MTNLTLAEQETHFNLTAANRDTWNVYSDDPVMQRKLERIGATLTEIAPDGIGRHYTLPANQLSLRNPKKPPTEAQKRARRESITRLAQRRAT